MMTINEGSSGIYTATLLDASGAPIPGATITSLKLTLSDKKTGTVINARTAQECVPLGGASGVSVDAAGHLTWELAAADAMVVTDSEKHPAILALWVVQVGETQLTHQDEITVINLAKYPAA